MWLVFDAVTATVIQRGFETDLAAVEWVQKLRDDGVEAAQKYIICPDAPEGFDE